MTNNDLLLLLVIILGACATFGLIMSIYSGLTQTDAPKRDYRIAEAPVSKSESRRIEIIGAQLRVGDLVRLKSKQELSQNKTSKKNVSKKISSVKKLSKKLKKS